MLIVFTRISAAALIDCFFYFLSVAHCSTSFIQGRRICLFLFANDNKILHIFPFISFGGGSKTMRAAKLMFPARGTRSVKANDLLRKATRVSLSKFEREVVNFHGYKNEVFIPESATSAPIEYRTLRW